MIRTYQRLWREETGALISAELIIIFTILIIGILVGVKSIRDAIVTELADVAQAISNFDQSYFFGGVSGHHAATGGGTFEDKPDFCDQKDNINPQESKGVSIKDTTAADVFNNRDGSKSP